ncbi:DUF3096 domain-containing protein [Candidatus Pacearchaeota archaeon]|nr:DUF3096 domain-containing protein [Candidatus Pacearchaeota archaeon]
MVAITLTISAILAIIFGIIILVWPKSLNYIVAAWFLIYGILQLLSDLFLI